MERSTPTQGHYYRSLARNMILAIIIVSFIPVFFVSSTIFFQFRVAYREKVVAHLQELVQKHKQRIDDFLKEKLSDIKFLISNSDYSQLRDPVFLQKRLASLQQEYGLVFVDLGVVNAEGQQIAYAGPFKLGGANYAKTDWFQKVMLKNDVISDVFLGLRGLPHFIVAVKGNEKGEPWILRATIDFGFFNWLVEHIRIGETGFAYILNKNRQFQTHPSQYFSPNENWYSHYFLDDEALRTEKVFTDRRIDESGVESIYVAAFLKDKNWLLVYKQDYSDAFSELIRIQNIALAIFILGGLAIVAMAYVLSTRMVKRIEMANREKEMMNQQVIETGKLASIGELAAGIAHEINNPVAIMMEEAGWLGDLIEEENNQNWENRDEFYRSLKQINTQGKRCKEITQKLLSFARKTDSRVQTVQINEMIEDVVGLSAQRAKYASVKLITSLQEGLPTCQASMSELQQVFLNLINNALDAMEKKGGTINLTTQAKDNLIRVSIEDDGPGIPKANIERIFDPFFTTKPMGKGTGLGLSICYGIVNKMGGEIEVKSSAGVGTLFNIQIPVTRQADQNPSDGTEHKWQDIPKGGANG